ncbi:MAG: hypothetical protein ACRC7N_04055 [Clostridium sp.]
MIRCKTVCELDRDGENICCQDCDVYCDCGNRCEEKPYNCTDKIEISSN